jgi:histidinol-phosphatase
MNPDWKSRADLAVVAAREAGDLARAIYDTAFDVEWKSDHSPVTVADKNAERAVRATVAKYFPGDGFLGEEFGHEPGTTGYRWIIDPIDGTRNYVRGIPVWATLIALERDGVVEVGVASAPALGRRWWAARGEGAYAGDGERIHVSAIARIEDAAVSATSLGPLPAGWARLAGMAWNGRGFGDFWQHCLVAEGVVDVSIDADLQLWDYAAIQLIVEEAGGRCSTAGGDPPAPGESFLAANPTLHAAVLALLA